MPRVLTITLNPAIDITTAVPALVPETKLRCEPPRLDPGGGGVNVSRVIEELGGSSTALVAVAGPTGALMRALLADTGVDVVFLEANGMTRESFSVHDRGTGHQFRFVLPGPTQDRAFGERALSVISKLLSDGEYPYVVASGSLPPGLAEDFYGRVAELVRSRGSRLILDTSGPALKAALGCGVYLVKPDFNEAGALAAELGGDVGNPEGMARSILGDGGAEVVIVTLGADGALLVTESGSMRIRPPHVEVVSAVGAGDSFVAALSFALANGRPLEQACAYGVAAAAAAVTTEATELAHKPEIDRLYAAMNGMPGADRP